MEGRRHREPEAEERELVLKGAESLRNDVAAQLGRAPRDGELHAAHRARHVAGYWDYVDHLAERYDYHRCRKIDADEMADMLGMRTYHGGYLDQGAGHLHPLNLALGLANAAESHGARIFEGSAVTDYRDTDGGVTVTTDRGRVRADYLVLACNGYLGRLARRIESFQMPINNFVLATEPLGEARARRINRDDLAVVDSRFVVNYFHNSPDHRLIFGGGENYSPRFPKDLKRFVRRFNGSGDCGEFVANVVSDIGKI